MKKTIPIFIITIIIAVGVGGYFAYSDYYASIGETPPSISVLTVNEHTLEPMSIDWVYPVLFDDEGKAMNYSYDRQLVLIEGEGEPLNYDLGNNFPSATMSLSFGDDELIAGTPEEVFAYPLTEEGTYSYKITLGMSDPELGFGTMTYYFEYLLTLPPPPMEVNISSTDIVQGDTVSIYVRNLPEDVSPSIESELGSTLFTEQDGVYSTIIPTGYLVEPGSYTATVTLGEVVEELVINVSTQDFEVQSFTMDSSTASLGDSEAANAEYREKIYPLYDTKDENKYWEGEFLLPAEGRFSSEYGMIRYINGEFNGYHGGTDIAGPIGTPVIAPNHAKVEFADFLQLSGGTIVLDYGGGLKAYMFHLDAIHVEAGDIVEKGQLIADMGTTGFSTGSHLHYQLQIDRYAIDPMMSFEPTSGLFEDTDTE